MASSSGTSSAMTLSEDMKAKQEQRKRRRMDSNRESARRSRMRKRKQLEDLAAEAEKLKASRNTAITTLAAVNQHYMAVEAENCVLRARVGELSSRLQELNEIITYMNGLNNNNNNNNNSNSFDTVYNGQAGSGFGLDTNPWSWTNSGAVNLQPLMVSGDLFHCY